MTTSPARMPTAVLLGHMELESRREALHSLAELFELQASRTPDSVAVSLIGQSYHLTYRALSKQSDQLARKLAAAGAVPESIIGVHLERTPKYLVAVLAALKCGCAFMALDPRYPQPRLEFMMRDSGARLLITEGRLEGKIKADSAQTILLDEPDREIEPQASGEPSLPAAVSLAYVVYTSGSSGEPKGVLCPELGLLNRLEWMSNLFPYESGEIASQIVPLSFVDSVYEIFGPLLQGIELRIIPDQIARGSAMELIRTIDRERITRIIVVPSLLAVWLDCIASLNRSAFPLKYCFVSGEVFPSALAKRCREILPHTRFINFYGSSELCHHATWFEISDTLPGKAVPIGRPIASTEAHVLDSSQNPVPMGQAGELYMGGPGMARGYLNRPELTAARFIENPFGPPGTRLFKTADRCRILEDGNLEYLGRIDDQVKIRGSLVEPAEVEAALKTHPYVQDAVVGAREDASGDKKLVAWLILRLQGSLTAADLQRFLEGILPAYSVPSCFMFLSTFPRLPNNKVNRREMPNPFESQSASRPSGDAPRPGIETRLANIWETLLKRGGFDRTDDFFNLGADSLQAIRMVAMIEDEFGLAIPMQRLLECPTIAQLASAIEDHRSSMYPRYIVPIQPHGSRMRFFCFGAGPSLKRLAQELGPDQPFFGITLDEQDTVSSADRATRLEEWVRRLLISLREFQPDGPYCLGGYSLHGLFAYEAARQLQAQGQEIAALILIDTFLPVAVRDSCPAWMRAGSHLSSLGHHFAKGDPQSLLRHLRSLSSQGGLYFRRKFWKSDVAPALVEDDSELALRRLFRIVSDAYIPQPYHDRITLIEVEEHLLGAEVGARFGWEHVSGGRLEIRTVPGDHNTMLLPPHVGELAREIGLCLNGAPVKDDPAPVGRL